MDKVILPNDVMLGEVARLLREGRDVVFVPKGVSMLPFIRGEVDSVLLRKKDSIKIGDIVFAHFGGRYLMHRVYAIEGNTVILMGDGNLKGTEQGPVSDVLGTVIDIISPNQRHHKPGKARLWRRLLPVRRWLLKIYRKWNKLTNR